LFGRPIGNAELMERLNALTTTRLEDLAGRLFIEGSPTVSALGPVDNVPGPSEISQHLGGSFSHAAE
ncbi:MAG: insulinase family protein, partial [Pseudomonadota bacterium]